MKILRVFPRKTKASPDDELVVFGLPKLFIPQVDEVHISVTFTWDLEKAKLLADVWNNIYPTKLGGPAFNESGGIFTPGLYLKKGYIITSRGCPNKCWFCSVWKREKELKELPITEGWNVLDDNILACSETHIRNVFTMLKRQPQKIEFTGGLEAKRLKDWHIDLLVDLKPKQFFFAYDTEDDYEPLVVASKKLIDAGFSRAQMRCYVLIGYKNDSLEKAEIRLKRVLNLGFFPAAMVFKNENGECDKKWRKFQRLWFRPIIIYMRQQSGEI